MIYQRACDIVTDDVFLELDGVLTDSRLFLKLEGMNPAGSVKLKSALGMVEDAEKRGVLWPGGRMVESSSGSLGIALAVIAAARGYHFTCVTDPNISPRAFPSSGRWEPRSSRSRGGTATVAIWAPVSPASVR